MQTRKLGLAAALAIAAAVSGGVASSASPGATRAGTGIVTGVSTHFGMTQSNNWSGYNQGVVEKKGKTFHEVSATWVVPTATQNRNGEAESSATWVGIGGGCLALSCLVVDQTLIQAGTEQDVDSSGRASYWAWWEIIPAPSTRVSLPVSAGQRVHVDVAEGLPEVWKITITNQSTGGVFTKTIPYPSSHATAEFILETPLLIGGGGAGISAMPRLSTVVFDPGTVNKQSPQLVASEAIQLVSPAGQVLATPSAPDGDADGFADCSFATSCGTNGS